MNQYTTHTPGPWKQYQWEDKTYASVRGPDGRCVADCGSRSDQIAQANARLIAAAPDLLAALEIVAAGNTDPDRVVEIASAAITKATALAA